MRVFISIFFVLFFVILSARLKLSINYFEKEKRRSKIRFDADVQVFVLGFVRIFSIKLKDDGIRFLNFKIPYRKIFYRRIEIKNLMQNNLFESMKNINIKIEKFYLKMELGIENIILLTAFIGVLSTIISFLLSKNITKTKLNNCFYQITPIYNLNLLSFDFSMRFSISFMGIIKNRLFRKNNSKSKKFYNVLIKPREVKI